MSSSYCIPTNAGMPSEPRAVYRRLASLLTVLDSFSWAICSGPILDDIHVLRNRLQFGLEADGCFITYDGGDNLKIYEPGSKTGQRKAAERAARLTGDPTA